MQISTRAVNVFTELDRLGVKWISSGEDEIKILCPVHDDSTPSASLNVREHTWKCFSAACGASGDFISYLAYVIGAKRSVVLADLQQRYPAIAGISVIPSQTVEKFHADLAKAGPLLSELRRRGVTEDMMREARLGFHDGRITIPVYDELNRCINIRRYLPGAPGPQKMRNTTGHGSPALYRIGTIAERNDVVICGGEMKALVLGSSLKDVAAVASTGGEGHWKPEWTALLEKKNVYICLDIDDAGVSAARKMAISIHHSVASLKVIKLPLDKKEFPKGDINDWFGQCGATAEDFRRLMVETETWIPPTRERPAEGNVLKLHLREAVSQETVGQVIEVEAVIAAADQTPYLVPKDVIVDCGRDQPGCNVCAVRALKPSHDGTVVMKVEPGSPAVIGMVGAGGKSQNDRMMQALGIPLCKTVRFNATTHHIARDVRLAPPISLSADNTGDAWYPAIIVSDITPELNTPCRMQGSVHPNPNTQQAVALISNVQEIDDSLSTFKCSKQELDSLRIFKPGDQTDEELTSKVDLICRNLASNVTWIYERKDLHIALMIAWHSVLRFNLSGREINGWINALIIGDSAQGKSEAAARLMSYYGLGDKIDCKNATVAGLLGGLEQMGGRWFVRWGAIPTRDRMIVHMEELKGASTEVISRLTEMRSSGVAEIPKIERRKALARTRLIMISNPRSPRPMASFHYGVEAIQELVGALEDVRRFDYAIALGRGEVSEDVINMPPSRRPKTNNLFPQEMSKRLVLWSWTRKPDQIGLSSDTEDQIVVSSKNLSTKFSESIPLVDKGTIRLKIARMACAVAAMTFSSPDGEKLIIEPRHVRFVEAFLNRIYSSKIMGYEEFSAAQEMMSKIQDPDIVIKAIRSTRFPKDLASVLLRRDTISVDDIQAASAVDYDTARTLLSTFVRKGALLRVGRAEYAKNPQFIDILKRIRADDKLKTADTEGDEF